MTEPVEALLFDLGGVVIHIDFARAVQRWSEYAGRDLESLWHAYEPGEPHRKHERGEIDDNIFFASLRDEFQIDLSDAQLLDGWNAIYGGIIPGVDDQLKNAAALVPLYAFTNTNRAHERYWSVAYADTMRHFRHIFVSSTIGLRKPEAQAFAYVADAMGVKPERILFFDDSITNIDGARASGFQTVLVRNNGDVADALARVLGTGLQR